jgi:predicted TIM-barrel fold metal-dependent hydrolase
MGGVFERFPSLRFGAIEFGATWVAPMAERLDRHASLLTKVGVSYSLKPSEFLRRNVRVTPFWTEPVDRMVLEHGLREVYVFNSDYPHVEGGRRPLDAFSTMTERVGSDYTKAFFVENARLLFPQDGAPR